MFWTQDYVLPNGVVVSYWKILSTTVESENKTGVIRVKGYLNQAAYEAGKEHIMEMELPFDFSVLDPNGDLLSAVIQIAQAKQLERIAFENQVPEEP